MIVSIYKFAVKFLIYYEVDMTAPFPSVINSGTFTIVSNAEFVVLTGSQFNFNTVFI